MSSQTDLDQGGTSRQWVRDFMGPSVGWVMRPLQNVLVITAAGTYTLDPSTSLVQVNVAGAVTVILPSAANPLVGPQALPGLFVKNPVTIVDIGGNAASFNITIQRNASPDTIMGLTQIAITVPYGAFTLIPVPDTRTWSSISP